MKKLKNFSPIPMPVIRPDGELAYLSCGYVTWNPSTGQCITLVEAWNINLDSTDTRAAINALDLVFKRIDTASWTVVAECELEWRSK